MTDAPKFVVILEKKGRGRGLTLVRPWAVRTFKLSGQNFEYYDGDKLKGTLDMNGAKCKKLLPSEADNKEYPFVVDTGKEKVLLNASSEDIRNKCLEFLQLSSTDKNWSMPQPAKLTVVEQKEKEFEAAESAAVVGIMASGLEVARLEEENRKLEEQRKKQVEEATASAMASELANLKLRQAAEAEAKQREEQERQVMEMLKGMGAKLRFKAALKAGKMDVARVAGAMMLQGAWRAKCARRRMVIKKAEKDRLRLEGCARKIQSKYRSRLARRRMEKVKAEKLRNKQKIAVLKAQCAWRIYIARKKYRQKQAAKLEAEFGKSVSRQRGFIRVQKMARAFIARKKVAALRIVYPSVLTVKVTKIDGCNISEAVLSEPFSFVSGMVLSLPADHEAIKNSRAVVSEETIKSSGLITSIYRTGPIASSPSALAVSLNGMTHAVVTVVDKDSAIKDDFLGQAVVRLSDHPRVLRGEVEVTVPLQNYQVRLLDEKNEPLTTVRKAATGTVSLSLSMPNHAFTMCGWLWKVSESMLSSAWKRRWFILVNGQLQYFNTDISLEQPKNVVLCKDVTSVTRDTYKGRSCLKISYKTDGVENSWMVDWDESESKAIQNMWIRKLNSSCPALIGPELIDPVRAKLESRGINIVQSDSGSAVSPMAAKTKVPVSRRISIFK